MKPLDRVVWIALISAGAAFSAGMYLAGLEQLAKVIGNPRTLFVLILAGIYLLFFILVLTNEKIRNDFVRALGRTSEVVGDAVLGLVGVSSPNRYERSLTSSDLDALEYYFRHVPEAENTLTLAEQRKLFNAVRDEVKRESKENEARRPTNDSDEPPEVQALRSNYNQIRSASSTVTIRGFVNLILGILFASGALYFLRDSIALVGPDQLRQLTTQEVTYLVATRISFSLIITLIAYFFLSLYRKSLDDVKFYQNELTYISGRLAALLAAVSRRDNRALTSIIPLLMNADRNIAVQPKTSEDHAVDYEKIAIALLDKLPNVK